MARGHIHSFIHPEPLLGASEVTMGIRGQLWAACKLCPLGEAGGTVGVLVPSLLSNIGRILTQPGWCPG